MEKKGAMRFMRWVTAMAAAVMMLLNLSVESALAQFDSGSSGIHGIFPPPLPDPDGAGGQDPPPIAGDATFVVWNIRTGTVRYCNSYDLTTRVDQCGPGHQVAQIPNIPPGGLTTGVYHFTNFALPTINSSRHLVIVGHSPNTPLTILSQQDVDFPGGQNGNYTLHINGLPGKSVGGSSVGFAAAGASGGPGGFDGGSSGNGGATPSSGAAGFGPAGGAGGDVAATTLAQVHGALASVGPLNPSLTPLSGGSGGGGAAGVASGVTIGTTVCGTNTVGFGGGPGGGGGGALLLAATNMVRLGGGFWINAQGGNGGNNGGTACALYGGGGAGGSVRIVAQQVAGTGTIQVGGGFRPDGSGTIRAPGGFVRIETASNLYTGAIDSASGGSFVSFPTAAVPTNLPTLQIVSVGGSNAPTSPVASLSAPDITFGSAIDVPVSVVVAATNVPTAADVTIKVVPAVGAPTGATITDLTGTFESSTGSVLVTLPPGAGVITASATFNVSGGGGGGGGNDNAFNLLPLIDGERATQVEVVAGADGRSRTYLIAKSGARFELAQALR